MFQSVAYRYQLEDKKKAVMIFYLVMVVIHLWTLKNVLAMTRANGYISINGMESASAIFLFIVGLNMFKEPFLMFMQNGITRLQTFWAGVLSALTVSAGMSAIDGVLSLLQQVMATFSKGTLKVGSLCAMTYGETSGGFMAYLGAFLFHFALYAMAMLIGLFVTSLFYRLNKTGKTIVGAGVPVFLFILLPILSDTPIGAALFRAFENLMKPVGQFFMTGSLAGMLVMACIAAIAAGLGWLLMRRAEVK